MHIAITNDDGYEAEGLAVLAQAARHFGQVSVFAPLRQYSQSGHAVTLNSPIRVLPQPDSPENGVSIVDGTPADCVRLAVTGLLRPKPDWVWAGINHGANLGVDIYYSGTVAAAREAAIHGIPAIAFSQFIRRPDPPNWAAAERMVGRVFRAIIVRDCPRGTFWSVNFPALEDGAEEADIVEVPVAGAPLPLVYQEGTPDPSGPTGSRVFSYAGRYVDRIHGPDSDVAATFAGKITLSRMSACP